MNEYSTRISNAIKNAGLSYAKLSKLTGISKSTLQRYSTGETEKISIDKLELIAKATNVPVEYLICLKKNEIEASKEGKENGELIKKYSQLSEGNKLAVKTLIDNLLSAQSM